MPVTSKTGRTIHIPTPAEDAAINAGIAADKSSQELDEEFFRNARPAHEVLETAVVQSLVETRKRGRPTGSIKENTKIATNIRFDSDVLEALKATGRGWQTRANDLIRAALLDGRASK